MVAPKQSKSLIVVSSAAVVFDNPVLLEDNNSDQTKEGDNRIHHYHDEGSRLPLNQQQTTSPPRKSPEPPLICIHKYEIFIGNLKHDVPDRTLINNLQELFTTQVSVRVPDFRFQIFHRDSKRHPRKYGFVVLGNSSDEEKAYQLNDTEDLDYVIEGLTLCVTKRLSIRNKLTKWNKLTFNGRKCLVNRSKSDTFLHPFRKSVSPELEPTTPVARKREFHYGQHLPTEDRVTEYKRGSGNYMKNMLIHHVRKYVCAFLNSEGMFSRVIDGNKNSVRASYDKNCLLFRSKRTYCAFMPHLFYDRKNSRREIFETVVHQDGDFLDFIVLSKLLVCLTTKTNVAFLLGGRLMIGVDDTCKVYGISCTRKQEDIARCQIDNTIKQFQPHVFPHMYMVDFIPVKLMPNDNIEFDSIDPLLKVLEVSVVRQNVISSLYTTDKENVFMRRDGSVEGPLRISQIIEWCRTHFLNINSNNNSSANKIDMQNSICERCAHEQGDKTGTVTLANKLEEITHHQDEVLKQLEESLLMGRLQLEQQVVQLKDSLEKKQGQLKEINRTLEDTQVELSGAKRRLKQSFNVNFLCTIL